MDKQITIIGGGLAGCEAAWRLSKASVPVKLYEMKPHKTSPAHASTNLAELVCSNSFRSDDPNSAVGLLKSEMRRMGSLLMEAAEQTKVPAGKALAVDRDRFSALVTDEIERAPNIEVIREEIVSLDTDEIMILAAGPLASDSLSEALGSLIGGEHLHFYDAIAPIITEESIDRSIVFSASRYDETGEGDYLNCPFNREEYEAFWEALMAAEKTELHEFEKPKFFEGCLPIEVMAERGMKTLTFGPMKPVGLTDPRTGERPWAVLQLRRENAHGTIYNMVGFQTRLKRPEQDRIFRMIPGLENASFARYGSIHRNTFINSPEHLTETLRLKVAPNIFIAGQLSGVEGYVESAAMGILAGENAARTVLSRPLIVPPPTTALGALVSHLTDATVRRFQPSNVNFGLTPPAPKKMRKKERSAFYADRANQDFEAWLEETSFGL